MKEKEILTGQKWLRDRTYRVEGAVSSLAVRVVSQSSPVWRQGGVGSTDIAALMGCGWRGGVLSLWATKVEQQERASMKKVQLEQGSTEWLQWRQQGVGGSEVGSVVGTNPWKSAGKLYKEKVGEITGESENADMARGKKLEPTARQAYENLFGWGMEPLCVIHDEYDFVRCSLDGIRSDDALICEIKAPRANGQHKAIEIAAQPDIQRQQEMFFELLPYYHTQILYQLEISGAERCHFVSYCEDGFPPHERLVVLEILRNQEQQDYILKRVVEFWQFVQDRQPPPRGW